MCEVVIIAELVSLLMETVHIELHRTSLTCLTKEVYFLCLKYCGRISAEKVSRSLITNPLPDSAQLTTFPRSSRLIKKRVPPAFRRYCAGRLAHSSSFTSNLKKVMHASMRKVLVFGFAQGSAGVVVVAVAKLDGCGPHRSVVL